MSLRPLAPSTRRRRVSPPARLLLVLVALGTLLSGAVLVAPALAADDGIGTYYRMSGTPRQLDTRDGTGGVPTGPLTTGGEVSLDVARALGQPTAAVAAVVLNLTGVAPSAGTYLTAYPSGTRRPTASSINLAAGVTRANLATVPVGTDGKIVVYNFTGRVHVVADVIGWYARTAQTQVGAQYYLGTPTRLHDTRVSQGGTGPLTPGAALDLSLDYGDDDADVVAVTVNVLALAPTAAGYLAAWDGVGEPTSSTLNFRAGATVPNLAVVPTRLVDGRPSFSVANASAGRTEVVVDVVGVYLKDQTAGLRYAAVNRTQTPTRIVDTRNGTGGIAQKLAANVARSYVAASSGPNQVAGSTTYGLIANLTATAASGSTYLSLYASGTSRPTASNLNLTAGQTVANAAVVPLANDFTYDVYNRAGTVHAIIDVTGRFDLHTTVGARVGSAQRGPGSADARR